MAGKPDLKPEPRVKDPDVYRQFHSYSQECLSCGNRHVEAAHLLRGKDREDVLDGLIPLCHGCHECFDKRTKYRGDFGHMFTPEGVDSAVARYLRHEAGDDQRNYLISRKGMWGAELYLLKLEGAA